MIKIYKADQLFDNSVIKEKTSYDKFKTILNQIGTVENDLFIVLDDESLKDLNPFVHFEDMADRLLGMNKEYLWYHQVLIDTHLIEWGWQETAIELNLPFKKNITDNI